MRTADAPFLDTNILLRHLTADHPLHSPKCKALIAGLEAGTGDAWTTHLVVAEAVFVLDRIYKFTRQQIADALLPILGLPGLHMPQKRLFYRVFELYTSLSLGYVDCYHAALVERREGRRLLSYDTGFDRVSELVRIEP